MKIFKSLYLNNDFVPNDELIFDALENIGYNAYIPCTFLSDLLIVTKYKLLKIEIEGDNDYIKALIKILESSNIKFWITDTVFLLKIISEKYDLRIIENYASHGETFDMQEIGSSFNYSFDIDKIPPSVINFLNITEEQLNQILVLPEEVIEVLTISSGFGSFLRTSKHIASGTQQMNSYGEIVKIHKHNFADPLFKYKFSIKSYDIDNDIVVHRNSNRLILGYFLGNYKRYELSSILIKLLGIISINSFTEDTKIIIYSFYMDTYSKQELTTIKEIISFFSEPKQLKLFRINNSKAIESMIIENPGDAIVYLPNTHGDCYISNTLASICKINIISVKESKFNIQYSNICKKTGGTFVTI